MICEYTTHSVDDSSLAADEYNVASLRYVGHTASGALFFSSHTKAGVTAVLRYQVDTQLWSTEHVIDRRVRVLHVSQSRPFAAITFADGNDNITMFCDGKQLLLRVVSRHACVAEVLTNVPAQTIERRHSAGASSSSSGGGGGGGGGTSSWFTRSAKTYFAVFCTPQDSLKMCYLKNGHFSRTNFDRITGAYLACHFAHIANLLFVLDVDSLLSVYALTPKSFSKMHTIDFTFAGMNLRSNSVVSIPTTIFVTQQHCPAGQRFSGLLVPIFVENSTLFLSVETDDMTQHQFVEMSIASGSTPRISMHNTLVLVHEGGASPHDHILDLSHVGGGLVASYPTTPTASDMDDDDGLCPITFRGQGYAYVRSATRTIVRFILGNIDCLGAVLRDASMSRRHRVGALHLYLMHTDHDGVTWDRVKAALPLVMGLPMDLLDPLIVAELYYALTSPSLVDGFRAALERNQPVDAPVMALLVHRLRRFPRTCLTQLDTPRCRCTARKAKAPQTAATSQCLTFIESDLAAYPEAAGDRRCAIRCCTLGEEYLVCLQSILLDSLPRDVSPTDACAKLEIIARGSELVGLSIDVDGSRVLHRTCRASLPRDAFLQGVATASIGHVEELSARRHTRTDAVWSMSHCDASSRNSVSPGLQWYQVQRPSGLSGVRCLGDRTPKTPQTGRSSVRSTPMTSRLSGSFDVVDLSSNVVVEPTTGYHPLDAVLAVYDAHVWHLAPLESHLHPLIPHVKK
eukprot:PhM_4_TR16183/c0_g1_i1/m.92019